ncbi:MAG: serine hydrolase domain-containing protein [Minicystis sp.]
MSRWKRTKARSAPRTSPALANVYSTSDLRRRVDEERDAQAEGLVPRAQRGPRAAQRVVRDARVGAPEHRGIDPHAGADLGRRRAVALRSGHDGDPERLRKGGGRSRRAVLTHAAQRRGARRPASRGCAGRPDLRDLRPKLDPARPRGAAYEWALDTEESMTKPTLLTLIGAATMTLTACAGTDPETTPDPPPPLPAATLQQITSDLVTRSGAPGAIVGVLRGDQRWIGAAGSEDLGGVRPMRADRVFRAASITKMFTASLVMKEVEAGALRLDDRLSTWEPDFANADAITIDELLSHTAGVTTMWFDQPALQSVVTADLTRVFTPEETLAIMREEPPFGAPGASGMAYANTDYVLLGEVLHQLTGSAVGDLMASDVFARLPLPHTTYQFDPPKDLVSGWFEYQGLTLDTAMVPQEALVSFAGAAGAVHTTAGDLLTFADALFRKGSVVGATSLARMMTPAEGGSWYAHGMMRFCPCADGPNGTRFTGFGHAGNLPGYWSEVVYYPDRDVVIVAMINRDMVNGVALDHAIFDPTLASVLDALAPAVQ